MAIEHTLRSSAADPGAFMHRLQPDQAIPDVSAEVKSSCCYTLHSMQVAVFTHIFLQLAAGNTDRQHLFIPSAEQAPGM